MTNIVSARFKYKFLTKCDTIQAFVCQNIISNLSPTPLPTLNTHGSQCSAMLAGVCWSVQKGPVYHWCVSANPANPNSPCLLAPVSWLPSFEPKLKNKKKRFSFSFALLRKQNTFGGRGGGGNLAASPLSRPLFSENTLLPNPARDDGNRAGRLPRWNIGFCLLPSCGDQLGVMSNRDKTERGIPASALHSYKTRQDTTAVILLHCHRRPTYS